MQQVVGVFVGLHPEHALLCRMPRIETVCKLVILKRENTKGQCDAQTGDVDEHIPPVAAEVAESEFQVVL